jgi:hypothetical protein
MLLLVRKFITIGVESLSPWHTPCLFMTGKYIVNHISMVLDTLDSPDFQNLSRIVPLNF